MKYAPDCLCAMHEALDFLNSALKVWLSPETVPLDVMHTCKINAQKAELDSMVFIIDLKAHGPPTMGKSKALSGQK